MNVRKHKPADYQVLMNSLIVFDGLSGRRCEENVRSWPKGSELATKQTKPEGKKGWKEKVWRRNSAGTCDSPHKRLSHRRDLLLSNTLSLTNLHTYCTAHRDHGRGVGQRTWEWDALKNKPSFGQSGFRWLGCSFKGEQLSGSAYYFNGCKAPMFWSVAHFKPAARHIWDMGSRLWPHLSGQGSSCRGLDGTPSLPLTDDRTKKSKRCKLNSSVVRESQTWPDKEKRNKSFS